MNCLRIRVEHVIVLSLGHNNILSWNFGSHPSSMLSLEVIMHHGKRACPLPTNNICLQGENAPSPQLKLLFSDKSTVQQEVARCLSLPFLNIRPLGISAWHYTMRNVGWGRRQCNWNVKGLSSIWFEGWPKAQITSYFKQTIHNIRCHFVGNAACFIWLVQRETVPTLGAGKHTLY